MPTETASTEPTVYQVRAARKGFDNEIDIAIMTIHPLVGVCTNLELKTIEPGEEVEPVMTIVFEEATALMTDLWNAGIRPEGVDLADSKTLNAVQAHLNDARMFAVAFWNKMSGVPAGAPAPPRDKDCKIIQFPGKKNPDGPDGAGQDKQ